MPTRNIARNAALGGVIAIGALFAACAYLGAFTKVEVSEQTTGPFYYVYQESQRADQGAIGEITTRIQHELAAAQIQGARPLDVFRPSGDTAANEVGFALQRPLTPEQLAAFDRSIRTRVIPAQSSMVARFPWRNPLSFVVGFVRVAPALRQHRQAHGYADGPAYTLNEGPTIAYIQPIAE